MPLFGRPSDIIFQETAFTVRPFHRLNFRKRDAGENALFSSLSAGVLPYLLHGVFASISIHFPLYSKTAFAFTDRVEEPAEAGLKLARRGFPLPILLTGSNY